MVRIFDDSAAALALRTGKVAILVAPASATDSVRYVYDRGRSDAVNARVLVDRAVQMGAGRVDPVRVSDTYVTEAGSRYIDFLIPGLLGMNLMGGSIWGIGFSIVTARSKKLLKRFMATPMSRGQYLLSFLASRLVFLILEVVTLLGFGHFAFGVPLRGSLVTLFLISLLGAISFGGLGLLAASRARTVEAVSGNHELHHAPNVDLLGSVLLVLEFPAGSAAVRQGASADRGKQCASRQHARGRVVGCCHSAAADNRRVGSPDVLRRAQAVPLAVTM